MTFTMVYKKYGGETLAECAEKFIKDDEVWGGDYCAVKQEWEGTNLSGTGDRYTLTVWFR